MVSIRSYSNSLAHDKYPLGRLWCTTVRKTQHLTAPHYCGLVLYALTLAASKAKLSCNFSFSAVSFSIR